MDISRAIILLLLLTASVTTSRAAEVMVFAAASLTDALTEIGRDYQARTKDRLFYNFAASSILARQIEEGAPADIFISADEQKMDQLQKKGLTKKASRTALLSNRLVVVIAKSAQDPISSPQDLLTLKSLALAEPSTVPAGIYARRFLEKENLWDTLKPRIIPTGNVRGALAAVEAGNADAAFVYATDARISNRVQIAYEVPAESGPAIVYPAAIVGRKNLSSGAEPFLAFLQSETAGAIFRKYGFVVLTKHGG